MSERSSHSLSSITWIAKGEEKGRKKLLSCFSPRLRGTGLFQTYKVSLTLTHIDVTLVLSIPPFFQQSLFSCVSLAFLAHFLVAVILSYTHYPLFTSFCLYVPLSRSLLRATEANGEGEKVICWRRLSKRMLEGRRRTIKSVLE